MMYLKNLSRSKIFQLVVGIILVLIILLLTFQAGRFIGFRQAVFSSHLGDNYYRALAGPGQGQFNLKGPRGFWSDDLPNSHGAVGQIIKISLPTLIVTGPDNLEKVIKVENDTIVRRFRDSIKTTDLKVGDSIVVIGVADDSSQIVAKLIRLLP